MDIHYSDEKPLNQVYPVLRGGELVLGSAADDDEPVVDVHGEQVAQAERTWFAVDEGDVVDPEGILEWGVPEEVGENRLGIETGFDADLQPEPVGVDGVLGYR